MNEHLETRGQTFWYRRKIPLDVQHTYGRKKEIRHSLMTRDRETAKSKAHLRSVELDNEFAARRGSQDGNNVSLPKLHRVDITDSNIQGICQSWKRAVLESDDVNRMSGFADKSFDEVSGNLDDVEQPLRAAFAKGQLGQTDNLLRTFLCLSRIDVDEKDPHYQKLRYQFLQTLVETVELQKRRQCGDVVRTDAVVPQEAVFQHSIPGSKERDGMGMDGLFTLWRDAVSKRPVGTVLAFSTACRQFKAFIADGPVANVTKKVVIGFRDKLLKEDAKAKKTVETKLNLLAAMFQVAVDSEKLAFNPAQRIRVPKPSVPPLSRVPYDLTDIHSIFAGPVYTGGRVFKGGGGEAAKWLPPMGLYLGVRLEEICQLRVTDIVEDVRYGWYLNVTDVSEDGSSDTSVKTVSSRRRVPIHPTLIEAGFLRYVERCRKTGEHRLFPDLTRDIKGKWSGNWSKWWGRYARRILCIKSKLKVFHSTRHNFKDACREASIDEAIHDALTGHSGGGVGRDYGATQYPLKPLFEAIAKVEYQGLQLPVIEP